MDELKAPSLAHKLALFYQICRLYPQRKTPMACCVSAQRNMLYNKMGYAVVPQVRAPSSEILRLKQCNCSILVPLSCIAPVHLGFPLRCCCTHLRTFLSPYGLDYGDSPGVQKRGHQQRRQQQQQSRTYEHRS